MLAIRKGNFFVELELHSVNPFGQELITFRHCHENKIHRDFMTYRINRNASSSRAIPYERMKKWIRKDPAMPLYLGSNRPGMSVGPEIKNPELCRIYIDHMLNSYLNNCDTLHYSFNLHKEETNRFAEVFGWINVISTWNREQLMNAVVQRCSPEAATGMQRLLISMLRLYRQSEPQRLKPGEWHMPMVSDLHLDGDPPSVAKHGDAYIDFLRTWSVARSAWVSLKTVDDRVATFEEAKRRHDGCIESIHMTPCEHQKVCLDKPTGQLGTTPGYAEYRHMIPGQVHKLDDAGIDAILSRYDGRDFITKDGN